ncbi:SMI1/KNR4 family protein [Streptomyces cavernae]|uniref:SMI1/KNR4 family protein n=1 Tax=Streptomyces cavernae TaxID=2259034 RepID=UPI000FEBB5C4|nr:SMI1/KNR4 family protein [Streptomyces cavernae]
MTIDTSWSRIEEWLREHAQAAYASLPPAASAEAIRAAERACGIDFPPDVVASLARHDGSPECLLPGNYGLLGAARIAEDYGLRIRLTLPGLPGSSRYWQSSWLPLASNGAGDSLFVETAPGERSGRLGRHSHDDGGRFDDGLQYLSLDSLLSWTARALSEGSVTDLLDWVLTTDEDGFLDWEDADAEWDEVSVVWDMTELQRRYGPL